MAFLEKIKNWFQSSRSRPKPIKEALKAARFLRDVKAWPMPFTRETPAQIIDRDMTRFALSEKRKREMQRPLRAETMRLRHTKWLDEFLYGSKGRPPFTVRTDPDDGDAAP